MTKIVVVIIVVVVVVVVELECGTRGILALSPSDVNVIILMAVRESGRPCSVDVRVSERS